MIFIKTYNWLKGTVGSFVFRKILIPIPTINKSQITNRVTKATRASNTVLGELCGIGCVMSRHS